MVRVMSGPFRWASVLRAVRSVRGLDIGRTRSFRVLSGGAVFDSEGGGLPNGFLVVREILKRAFTGAAFYVPSVDNPCELVGVDGVEHGLDDLGSVFGFGLGLLGDAERHSCLVGAVPHERIPGAFDGGLVGHLSTPSRSWRISSGVGMFPSVSHA